MIFKKNEFPFMINQNDHQYKIFKRWMKCQLKKRILNKNLMNQVKQTFSSQTLMIFHYNLKNYKKTIKMYL